MTIITRLVDCNWAEITSEYGPISSAYTKRMFDVRVYLLLIWFDEFLYNLFILRRKYILYAKVMKRS